VYEPLDVTVQFCAIASYLSEGCLDSSILLTYVKAADFVWDRRIEKG